MSLLHSEPGGFLLAGKAPLRDSSEGSKGNCPRFEQCTGRLRGRFISGDIGGFSFPKREATNYGNIRGFHVNLRSRSSIT